jgi:hypothetical protein
MAFPTNPENGQTANINGVTYTYSTARSAWTVTSSFLETFTGNALVANTATIAQSLSVNSVTSDMLPAENETYDLGSDSLRWRDLYLAGNTLVLGGTTVSADGENLILPSTVQIGTTVLSDDNGNLSLPENILAVTITASGNVTGGNISTTGSMSSSTVTASGNVTGGNISTTGSMSAGTGLFTGNVTAVSVHPVESNAHDLGTSSLRWRNIYTNDLNLNNGVGDWTIVEGKDDLFLYNNKKNRVYKFALIEVDPSEATPKIDKLQGN